MSCLITYVTYRGQRKFTYIPFVKLTLHTYNKNVVSQGKKCELWVLFYKNKIYFLVKIFLIFFVGFFFHFITFFIQNIFFEKFLNIKFFTFELLYIGLYIFSYIIRIQEIGVQELDSWVYSNDSFLVVEIVPNFADFH